MTYYECLKSVCIWKHKLFFLSELLCFVDFINLQAKHVATHIQSWLPFSKKNSLIQKEIFMSLSASCHNQFLQKFPRHTSTAKSKQAKLLGNLAASIHSPCIYNCANRLTLCPISWRTQDATHIAAGSSPVYYTWSCLHYIAERGRCMKGTSWSWPMILCASGCQATVHMFQTGPWSRETLTEVWQETSRLWLSTAGRQAQQSLSLCVYVCICA